MWRQGPHVRYLLSPLSLLSIFSLCSLSTAPCSSMVGHIHEHLSPCMALDGFPLPWYGLRRCSARDARPCSGSMSSSPQFFMAGCDKRWRPQHRLWCGCDPTITIGKRTPSSLPSMMSSLPQEVAELTKPRKRNSNTSLIVPLGGGTAA
jgi:hypothetical protein